MCDLRCYKSEWEDEEKCLTLVSMGCSEHCTEAAAVSLARDVEGEVEAADDGRDHAQYEKAGLHPFQPKPLPLSLGPFEGGAVVPEPTPPNQLLL